MKYLRFTSNLLVVATLTLMFASTGAALPARTWVASNGADANACSRSSPCATFAGAFSKTAAGGEINCVDSGDFGPLSITKAITIDCSGNFGATLVPAAGLGFVVNAGASDVVTLRNLAINGRKTGGAAIAYNAAKALHLENIDIQGFVGDGVSVSLNANGQLTLENTTISDCGTGVEVTTSNPNVVVVDIHNTRIFNTLVGVLGEDGSRITIHDSNIYMNNRGVQQALSGSGNGSTLAVINSTLGYSIVAAAQSAAGAFLLAFGNAFINNTVAFNPNGGLIFTGSDNVNSGSMPGTANGGTAPKI